MEQIQIDVGYVMAAIVGGCVITILVVLASPIVLLGAAVIGAIWLLYAGLLLIGHLL